MSTAHDLRFDTLDAIRLFFHQRQYRDVLTPPAVENPGMEAHLHPFQLFSPHQNKTTNWYLHTSPEFSMKELLSQGFDKIFTLNYCFRDEPQAQLHRPQFIMLEWYQAHARYMDIAQETKDLIQFMIEHLDGHGHSVSEAFKQTSWVDKTVAEVFLEFSGLDLLSLESSEDWVREIKTFCPELSAQLDDKAWPYEDYFFLVFLNIVEPNLKKYPKLILKDYPSPLAALSKIHEDNPKLCKRFELYLDGVEIANCFEEETSVETLQDRFTFQAQQKRETYKYDLQAATTFLETMKRGIPPSSGIALGVERLAGALCDCPPPFWDTH